MPTTAVSGFSSAENPHINQVLLCRAERNHTKFNSPDASASAGVESAADGLVLASGAQEQLVLLAQQEEVMLEVWMLVSNSSQ